MYPILFSIGPLNFYSYGFFISLSFITGYLIINLLFKKMKYNTDSLIDNCIVIFIVAIVISRITYYIIYYNQFDHWYKIFYLWQGGLISYGGIIGALLAFIFYYKKNIWKNLDILAVAFWAGLIFWRIGCMLAGDHPTINSNSWFAINNHVPTSLFESIGGLIGFIIFSYLYLRDFFTSGKLFALTLLTYGLIRLIIDQWRLDPKIGIFTNGQFAGLILSIIGLLILIDLIIRRKYGKKSV